MTRTELDQAYNNSLAVANSRIIVDAWVKESAELRNSLTGELDIPYGTDDFQSFDFFPCEEKSPVIIFVHGGFWQMRAKSDFTFIVPYLLKNGFSVAMLGYTLAPHGKIGDIVADVKNGVSVIDRKVNTSNKNVPLWLIGWSAGAHLISMVLNESPAMGGTAISGIYDLEPMRHCYINDKLQLDEQSVLLNSPINRVVSQAKTLDLIVGGDELPEMIAQTQDFNKYREKNHGVGEFNMISEKNHYTIFDVITHEASPLFKRIHKALDK